MYIYEQDYNFSLKQRREKTGSSHQANFSQYKICRKYNGEHLYSSYIHIPTIQQDPCMVQINITMTDCTTLMELSQLPGKYTGCKLLFYKRSITDMLTISFSVYGRVPVLHLRK